ncbi:PAS domain S-box protein, partial [candidate division WOR-3 bacterium]|nr:PAS domain S-box protein [candidate division WOR-3 bacterium]MBD3364816.1 PAS domain S-box protein [candidate division WOR-3 bacterium]
MMKSRILIVEDERIVAGDVKSRIESLGYEVVGTVATGEEAVFLAERERPDLVLMDIMLKGDINGIQAAEQIKTFYDIPVVYLTAYADEETLQRVKASEPFGYIVKPFEQRVLHTTIEIALYQSQMEKALKEKEELYRTLIETSPDAIVLTDLEGNLIMVNKRAASLYGQPGVNDLIGLNVFDILATKDRKRAYDDARKTLKRERIDDVEYLLTRKDGSYFPGEVSASVVRDAKGRAKGLIAVIRDISGRKSSEVALKKSEERYRALTEEALVGVYIYSNKRRKYIFVNPAMEKITGYSREELLTIDPNKLALPEGKKLLAEREKAVKEGREKPSQYMIRILRKDGSIAVLEVRTRPIEDEGEVAALGNCIDVTGIIKQKEQIERAKLEWERTFDATSDLVMIVDKDQGIMRANKAVADYAGLDFPELLKMTYFQLFH